MIENWDYEMILSFVLWIFRSHVSDILHSKTFIYLKVKKHGRHQVKLASDISADGQTTEGSELGSIESKPSDSSAFTLLKYFLQEFGPATSEQFMEAQRNFVQSCAA